MNTKQMDNNTLNQDIIKKVNEKLPDYEILCDLSDFFKVIGDGTRIQILFALSKNEMCVGDIATLFNLTKSNVSHQLKILRISNLVKSRRDGKNIFYSLNDEHVSDILEIALEHLIEKRKKP